MAERRMFAKTIIDSDAFLDMPLSAQALYFHLSMRADDEGFINNPKKIQRMIGASDDDMKILEAKNFIIPFESGIVVIKHWRIHNYIRADRLVETKYKDERALLEIKGNGAYTLSDSLLMLEDMSCEDKRKRAYENSTLPYSFTYKIRHAFEHHTCPICGKTMTSAYKIATPSVQHNIPIVNGGEHELYNISVICFGCNVSIRDKETAELNNKEVVDMWDRIVYADAHKIKWFDNLALLDEIDVCQVTDKCQTDVSIGKDSIDKNSIDKNKDILSGNPDSESVKEIIDYLNSTIGTRYTTRSKSTNAKIKARLKEGHTIDDFKIVIDNKSAQWKDNAKMRAYLRPETLFAAEHFESYLNEGNINGSGVQEVSRTDEEQRNAEIDEQIRRINAGEITDESPFDMS